MDYFYMNGRLYILICDYFSTFPFLFQVKAMSFAKLKDHLEELFSVEGIPDEFMSFNGPPFNGKEFSSYLTGLGISTDNKTNRWSSAYMSLSATYFAVPLVAVRLNYRTVTNSCVFTGHFIQNILNFGTIQILLFILDELFLCITFPKCNFYIYVVIFLSVLDSTISTYKCLVTCDLLRVTQSHCC